MKGNVNSSTEDAIGVLHKGITGAFQRKLDYMMQETEKNPADIDFIIDTRDLNAMAKWVEMNGITCASPEESEESDLSKDLAIVRERQSGKVITFHDKVG